MSYKATCEDDPSESSYSERALSKYEPVPLILDRSAMPSEFTPRLVSSMIPKKFFDISKRLLEMKQLIFRNAELAAQFIKSITAWIKTHQKETALIVIGIVLFALCLATPAILGAIGFGAAGSVLGSAAAGWQASMGTVAASSLFAFLQSAAMGGAAMGLFTGIGVIGAVMAGGGGLASVPIVKETCREVVDKAANAVKGGFQTVTIKASRLWRKVWGSDVKT